MRPFGYEKVNNSNTNPELSRAIFDEEISGISQVFLVHLLLILSSFLVMDLMARGLHPGLKLHI